MPVYYGMAMSDTLENAPASVSPRSDGIVIDRNGVWFHNRLPFTRPALVRLFSTVLKRGPDGGYMLETPVERVPVEVEDAPFVAVELSREGRGRTQRLHFRTNIDEWVTLGPGHGLRIGATRPYIGLRAGIEAAVARAPYYEMAELAVGCGEVFGVWSDGVFFRLDGGGDDP